MDGKYIRSITRLITSYELDTTRGGHNTDSPDPNAETHAMHGVRTHLVLTLQKLFYLERSLSSFTCSAGWLPVLFAEDMEEGIQSGFPVPIPHSSALTEGL